VVAGEQAGFVGGDKSCLRSALRCGAGTGVAQINLAAGRSVGYKIGGSGAKSHEAPVGGDGGSVAVGVALRAVVRSGKYGSLRLATGGSAGTSVAQKDLRVAVLDGGVGDIAAIKSESGSFF